MLLNWQVLVVSCGIIDDSCTVLQGLHSLAGLAQYCKTPIGVKA